MNRGAPYTVLYTFHVSLLVRQARPIRYHHLADLVPRSHLGITVVVLAAIHVVDRRSPLYLLDKPLRVKHVPRFSPFPRSLARSSFYLSQVDLAPFAARRLGSIFENLFAIEIGNRRWRDNLSSEDA